MCITRVFFTIETRVYTDFSKCFSDYNIEQHQIMRLVFYSCGNMILCKICFPYLRTCTRLRVDNEPPIFFEHRLIFHYVYINIQITGVISLRVLAKTSKVNRYCHGRDVLVSTVHDPLQKLQ